MKIVVSIHGVQSKEKNWQDKFDKHIKDSGRTDIRHIEYKYGWIFAPLSIFPFYQRHCIKKFRKWLYKNVYSKYGKNIIIVAHSFGTFIGFHGSDEVDKMILFGSVLHCRENFSGIVPDRIKEIHNFHSTTDEICMLNPIGHSGAWGIRCKNTKTKKWYRRPYKDKQIFNYKSIVTEHTQYFPLYFSNILKLIA